VRGHAASPGADRRGDAAVRQQLQDEAAAARHGRSRSGNRRLGVRRDHGHRHKVITSPAGKADHTETEQRHWHSLAAHEKDGKTTYEVGSAEGMLEARVPVYGKLEFLDRTGKPAEKGINVGDEWTYRSFITGGSLAAAVWRPSTASSTARARGSRRLRRRSWMCARPRSSWTTVRWTRASASTSSRPCCWRGAAMPS